MTEPGGVIDIVGAEKSRNFLRDVIDFISETSAGEIKGQAIGLAGANSLSDAVVKHVVARAGAWLDTGWPVTMESAVASGVSAARSLLRQTVSKVPA